MKWRRRKICHQSEFLVGLLNFQEYSIFIFSGLHVMPCLQPTQTPLPQMGINDTVPI
jgi:hypothetical protein